MPTQARPDPLRLAVCDDEAADRARIEQMAGAILHEESIAAEIAGYESAAALLAAIRAGRAFDVLLLDVMMEGMDGMALAAALRAGREDAAIIFISSNREMALRGYEVAASRYLAKPVDPEKLREALLHCRAARSGRSALALPTASGQSSVAPAAVLYAEAWERGVRLHLDGEILEVRLPFRRSPPCSRKASSPVATGRCWSILRKCAMCATANWNSETASACPSASIASRNSKARFCTT